jgi:Flp pilus assembly protein TadD
LRLAYTYLIDVELGWHFPPEERVAQARTAAERAVALDPADARAETALAYACLFCGDWDGAEIHVRRAVRLNPNDAEAMSMRGYVEACLGDNEGGLRQIEQAQRLNPFAPDYHHWVQGIALYALGRHAEALTAFREMRSAPTVIQANIAACYARLGRMDEARQAMAEFLRRAETEHARFAGTDAAAWREHFRHAMPSRDPAQLDRCMEGFRLAGLPG